MKVQDISLPTEYPNECSRLCHAVGRLLPVTLLKVETSINRLVAGGSSVVTVWDLTTLSCTAEFGAKEPVGGCTAEAQLDCLGLPCIYCTWCCCEGPAGCRTSWLQDIAA
jgi:hypothetical protein